MTWLDGGFDKLDKSNMEFEIVRNQTSLEAWLRDLADEITLN